MTTTQNPRARPQDEAVTEGGTLVEKPAQQPVASTSAVLEGCGGEMARADATSSLRTLIRDCQRDLAEYLVPDSGITREEVIARLLERLDGPQAREAMSEPASAGDAVARVVAAACRVEGITLTLPRPARHHTIMHAAFYAKLPGPILPVDQGFIDSDGNFLSRQEAWNVAVAAGQPFVSKPHVIGTLFSEDLW